ncbi:MAG: HD domain-containing protein [Patescibacteria group bacterium]|jgi:uncharacterized protein
MNKKEILQKTKSFIKKKLLSDNSGHDYWHVIRVFKIAEKIAKKEKANVFIVQLAALLHDIGEHGPAFTHTKSCASVAKTFLKQFKLTPKILDPIADCILTHSWSDEIGEPKTIEAKIIADCDAMDAVGAIGVIRTVQYCVSKNRPIHDPDIRPNPTFIGGSKTMVNHFYEKLLLLDSKMYTKTAKYIAKRRVIFMKNFLNEFLSEWDGKK